VIRSRQFESSCDLERRRSRYIQVGGARGDFVLTSERVLFIQRKLLGTAVEEIPLDRIDSVSHRTGLIMGAIQLVQSNGRRTTFDRFSKNEISGFVEAIRGAVAGARAGSGDVAILVRELKALRDEGVLSDDEFERAKERYLGREPDDRQAMLRTLSSLNDLRTAGVLTQVEFDIKKRDLLATAT